jgi:hypothetical protein
MGIILRTQKMAAGHAAAAFHKHCIKAILIHPANQTMNVTSVTLVTPWRTTIFVVAAPERQLQIPRYDLAAITPPALLTSTTYPSASGPDTLPSKMRLRKLIPLHSERVGLLLVPQLKPRVDLLLLATDKGT